MTPPPALQPRPDVAPPAPWRYPVPSRRQLDNGITVLAHHMPGQHAAAVACHLALPATAEPDGQEGTAAVLAAALTTGTRAIPAREFEQRSAAAGITWDACPGWTGPVITAGLPARQLPAALHLLGQTLAGPALDPAETTAQIQLAAAGIAAGAASPDTRLMQELPASVYGDGTRAGLPAAGAPGTIARITPDTVTAFRDSRLRPAAVTIVIAGDLTGLDPAALASESLAAWNDTRPAGHAGPPPEILPLENPAPVLVNQPGAAQAQILLAVPVPGRGCYGWTASQIAARILGAPLTGRLDAQVRERSGSSYGLQALVTELTPGTGTGLMLIGGAVDGPSAPAAIEEIRGILDAPHRDGFTAAEHTAAAESVSRMIPLAFETPALLAAATADLATCGLPPDYPDSVLDSIADLTLSQLNGAYKSRREFTLLAAGDADVLAGPLQDLAGGRPLRVLPG